MSVWIAESYAKINLGLHVLERLPTGYHRIETGFAFINWSDRLEVKKSDRMQLDVVNSDISSGEDNLINRAIEKIKRYVDIKQSYRVKVNKKIPAGAGLGGGSSNAATILRMLNKIEGLNIAEQELADLARDLGADIPFFLNGKTGIGTGLGHEIEEISIQPEHWIVTCFPDIESRTAEAYANCVPNPEPDFDIKRVLTTEPVDEWRFMLKNDLEDAVIPRHHLIGNLKDQMYELGAVYASMSGSGSSVYGIFEQAFVATDAYKSLLGLEYPVNITKPGFEPDYGIYRKEEP